MSEAARKRMTSGEFIAWAMQQDGRYELVAGEIVGMAPEQIAHTQRGSEGIILTRIVHEGPILLEPPGITLTDCFPPGVD